MAVEVIGLDHIYVAVSDLTKSTEFYDGIMRLLGFRKGTKTVNGTPYTHYFNRVLQYTLRPSEPNTPAFNQHAAGLHHFCFQLADRNAVDEAANGLLQLGIDVRRPRFYPQYGEDYYAAFFNDPDGIELEVVNRTRLRDLIVDSWDQLSSFENPLQKSGLV